MAAQTGADQGCCAKADVAVRSYEIASSSRSAVDAWDPARLIDDQRNRLTVQSRRGGRTDQIGLHPAPGQGIGKPRELGEHRQLRDVVGVEQQRVMRVG